MFTNPAPFQRITAKSNRNPLIPKIREKNQGVSYRRFLPVVGCGSRTGTATGRRMGTSPACCACV